MGITAYDTMREYMVIGSTLDGKYQMPMMPRCTLDKIPEDSLDFESSLARSVRGHKNLNVHFYIDDYKYERVWNQPEKYIDHFRCFNSVCAPDFSVSPKAPFPVNLWNKYRNHAIAWYFFLRGVNIVPAVGIYDRDSYDWCFDGYPTGSTIAVSTVGRIRNKESRAEFAEGFKVMCDKLEPTRILLVGKMIDEIQCECPMHIYETRTQKLNKGEL